MIKPRLAMPAFARRFRESFPDLGAGNRYLDPLLSAATMTPHLDPLVLEDAIAAKHGEIPDGESLADVVTRLYGAAATAFVREVL